MWNVEGPPLFIFLSLKPPTIAPFQCSDNGWHLAPTRSGQTAESCKEGIAAYRAITIGKRYCKVKGGERVDGIKTSYQTMLVSNNAHI
jgi:hypothetical protein